MNATRLSLFSHIACTLAFLAATGCGGSTSNDGFGGDGGGTSDDSGHAPQTDSGSGNGGSDGGATIADSGTPTNDATTPSGLVSVPLYSCIPPVYTAAATVGSQSFQFLFDTGSTTMAVAGSTCSNCSVTPEYTPGSTAQNENAMVTANYGSGSWTGAIYQDTVSLGSSPGTPSAPTKLVSITTQTGLFGNPMQCTSTSGTMQGLLGFGPSGAASAGTEGFFDAYTGAYSQVQDVFSIELCDTGGTLWLGGYDPAATMGAVQYTPMDTTMVQLQTGGPVPIDSLYYAVNLASVTVNGTTVAVGANGSLPDVVVDTGTSAFLLNSTSYSALTAAIEADSAFSSLFGTGFFAAVGSQTPSCKTGLTQTKAQLDAMLPALTLTFGSNPAITVKAAPTESYLTSLEGEWCSLLVGAQAAQISGLAGIFGAPIIKSNVVVYDRANKRVGFAPHAACP